MNHFAIIILCVYALSTKSGSLSIKSASQSKKLIESLVPLKLEYLENSTLEKAVRVSFINENSSSPEKRVKSAVHNERDTEEKQNEITTKDVAVILLVNSPRELSRILKENPNNRNEELVRLLFSSVTDRTVQNITTFLNVRETKIIANELAEERRTSSANKIEKLLENSSLIRKLNDVTLYLCDFLSLNSYEEISDIYSKFPATIEIQIKRLLYMNPEKLAELNDAYFQKERKFINSSENEYFEKDATGFNQTGVNCDDKKDITYNQFDKKCTEGKFQTSYTSNTNELEIDETASGVQTQDRETKDKEIKPVDISETSGKSLQFPDVPSGDDIHNLKMDDESLLFSALSALMAYLQPAEFPLGFAKDAFDSKIPLHVFVLQVMKSEGLSLCWVLFWAILALCLPFAVMAQMCCPKRNIQRLHNDSSSSSSNLNNKCTGTATGFVLYILLLLLLSCTLLMLVMNDKFSRATEKLPSTANVAFRDLETFIKNTESQISFVATTSFDVTMSKMNDDLKDVRNLLGVKVRDDIIRQTDLNATIAGFNQVKDDSAQISRRVRELLRECGAVKTVAKALHETLLNISKQVDAAREQCMQRDQEICESLETAGLDLVAFSTQDLINNTKLHYLERIGQDNDFNRSIDEAFKAFDDIPQHVTLVTTSQRTEMGDILFRRRKRTFNSVRLLEELSGSMIASLRTTSENISDLLENIASGDSWRYVSIVGTSFLLFLIWVVIMCGSPCGCHYTSNTIRYLMFGVVLTCSMSVVLWFLSSISFLVGGHGKAIICDPLYDDHFDVLSRILDKDGLLYDGGFFKHVLETNDSIQTKDVLRTCQRNQPSYTTFHLYDKIDLNELVNYQTWDDLRATFDKFSIDTKKLKIPSENLERHLEKYPAASDIAFKNLRRRIYHPVTRTDLNAFLERIRSVSAQLSDGKSVATFELIIFKLKQIINTELRVLENHRDSILYKLTALEILMQPLKAQFDAYLAKLQEARIMIRSGGKFLTEKSINDYILRFKKNLNEMRHHTNEQITTKLGRCKPIWEVFYYSRHHICKLLVNPMNGISFTCYVILAIFFGFTPIVINIIQNYKELEDWLSSTSITHKQVDEGAIINEQGVWVTPKRSTPSHGSNPRHQSSSTSEEIQVEIPSRPADAAPTPPRLPQEPAFSPQRLSSTAVSARSTPRNPQLFTISKGAAEVARTKYDSLKLIEGAWSMSRVARSPRNWM